jgi:hypothetical protein
VFRDRSNAHVAYDWLTRNGYTSNEINLLMSEGTKAAFYSDNKPGQQRTGSHAAEGMATGGVIGTAAGATAGAIAAIGLTVLVPGFGWVAGPVLGALAGGGAGAVAGGVIGGLIGLGISESNAHAYEQALREGGIVIGVVPRNADDASKIKDKFKEFKGENIVTAS